ISSKEEPNLAKETKRSEIIISEKEESKLVMIIKEPAHKDQAMEDESKEKCVEDAKEKGKKLENPIKIESNSINIPKGVDKDMIEK
ncbi:hypothetical protein KI387_029550, partial [Taxus chinensis]